MQLRQAQHRKYMIGINFLVPATSEHKPQPLPPHKPPDGWQHTSATILNHQSQVHEQLLQALAMQQLQRSHIQYHDVETLHPAEGHNDGAVIFSTADSIDVMG